MRIGCTKPANPNVKQNAAQGADRGLLSRAAAPCQRRMQLLAAGRVQ